MSPAFCPDIHTSTPSNILLLAVEGLVIGLAFSAAFWQLITREGALRLAWLIPILLIAIGTADIYFRFTSPSGPPASPEDLLGEPVAETVRLGVWLLYSGVLVVITAMSALWLIEQWRTKRHSRRRHMAFRTTASDTD